MDAATRHRIGVAVRQLRLAQGYASLKKIPGISHHTWGQVERGEEVTQKSLRTVAATLGIPARWLWDPAALPGLEEAARAGYATTTRTVAEATDFELIEELYRRHRARKVGGYMERADPESLATLTTLHRAAYPEPLDSNSESELDTADSEPEPN